MTSQELPLAPRAVPAPRSAAYSRALGRFAWGYWAYLVSVILFGAWVRISGSGAGCGNHWPSCHGEWVPRAPAIETLIEFAHRATSGLLGIATLILLLWVVRALPARHPARFAAWLTMALVLLEAAIGAGIVRGELVANDTSVARAVIVALHLVNTLGLTAAAGLLAHWVSVPEARPWHTGLPRRDWFTLSLGLVFVAVSMAGAVTALGDTLFPVQPTTGDGLFAHLKQDLSASAHFLVRLRIVHPIAACLLSLGLLALAFEHHASRDSRVARLAKQVTFLTWLQIGAGVINILLGAPGWLQLVHLLLSQLLWLAFVLLTEARWAR